MDFHVRRHVTDCSRFPATVLVTGCRTNVWVRFPIVNRWFSHIKSDIPTDDDEQPCYQAPPDIPYGERRLCHVRRACFEGNGQ